MSAQFQRQRISLTTKQVWYIIRLANSVNVPKEVSLTQQFNSTYTISTNICKCPHTAPTNPVAQICRYYDSILMFCQCYAPATSLTVGQWDLVWNPSKLLCECPHNSMYNSVTTKRLCQCTTVATAPTGTVKPTLNTTSGDCECPTGTSMNWTTKVCVCPTGTVYHPATKSCL